MHARMIIVVINRYTSLVVAVGAVDSVDKMVFFMVFLLASYPQGLWIRCE
jgi:hypothetical protein